MSDLHNKYFRPLERLLSTELDDKGSKFAEIMSLFFYHIYRKLAREEYQRLRDTRRRRKPRRSSAHSG